MDPAHSILIIEDEENLRHMLSVMLAGQGYRIAAAPDGAEGLRLSSASSFDFILCDIRMPVMDGKQFLARAIAGGQDATIIMMSAYGTVDTAIECMKMGAYDFISKPFKKDEIVMVLKKAEERERLKDENQRLRRVLDGRSGFAGIVSRNPLMEEIFSQILKVADLKTTVLIQGESGTGKELVARAIHGSGSRAAGPFVAVNCAAIPEALLESELFGHVRGAFTDALNDRPGLFRQADGGTIFLDEIGDMPLSLQVKLLRVLEDEAVRPLGSVAPCRVDVRVVAATSRNLEKELVSGRFREDLYFRLNVFTMQIPPLRHRADDIPLLAEHFLLNSPAGRGRIAARLSPDALAALSVYSWPGNVRELANTIERALILCDGSLITRTQLPVSIRGASPDGESLSIKRAEDALERDLIQRALARTGGNRTQAARLLEISHRTLLYKLKEYGIP